MNHLRGGLMAGLLLVSLAMATPHVLAATASAVDADGTPSLLTELQFKSTTAMTATSPAASASASLAVSALNPSGWNFGAQSGGSIGVQPTSSPEATTSSVNALEGTYPRPPSGGQYVWADYSVAALNTEDIYIEFWAKMPGAKEGCKFLKIFGKRITPANPTNYADVTFLADYTGVDYGGLHAIGFGDGSSLVNDSQDVIHESGLNNQLGRSTDVATVRTPQNSDFSSADWGTAWHHFRVHVKFNSGTTAQNEVPDGEIYFEIDGKVYVDAVGLYNRNPANGPIDYVELFGWAQTETQPFQLWYDDVRISTGGFMSTPLPEPPADVGAQVTTN